MQKALGFVIGIVLMVFGMWMYKNVHPEFLDTLEKSGVPLNPGKTVATIGVLLILFPLIKGFFVQPLDDAINGRTTELEHAFGQAESLRSDMSRMKTEYEGRLAQTEAEARAQIQDEIKKAQDLRKSLEAEAASRADDMKKRAEEEIAADRARAISELRHSTVDLTLAATGKLLKENVDDARNRKLIEDFIANAEVPA